MLVFIGMVNCRGQASPCRGDILMQKQDYAGAIREYQTCLREDTSDMRIMGSLAQCYLYCGDYATARERYHVLENVDSFRTEAVNKLATIYEAQQNLPKAIKYNLLLAGQFPENPAYRRKLGALYLQGREKKQAIQSYREALGLNPKDAIALQGLAEIMVSADSLDMADSLLTAGLAADSLNIGLSLLKSRVMYRQKKYSETAAILYGLSFRTELNNYYNKLLGYSYMQTDSLDRAIYHLQKSLLEESDPEYALFYLALAYERKKEWDRADWYFREAAKAGISQNLGQYYRGSARMAMQTDRNKEAIDLYKQSLEYEQDPAVYFYMANAADLHYKDKSKAVEYYRKYLSSCHGDKEFERISKQRIAAIKEQRFMKEGK